MSQETDPWQKAAECTRAIEATDDQTQREMLTHLRTLWIDLANERHLLDDPELAKQIAAIAQIHAGLVPPAAQ
jgi:hypothetical protein